MSSGLASWNILLLLFLSLWAYRSAAAIEFTGKHLNKVNEVGVHAHPSSHIDHRAMMFFTVDDLKVGKRMPVYFPLEDPSTSPKFLPKEVADSIPFSLENLPYLLELFSISPHSPQGKAMEDSLKSCREKPIEGEVKVCANSFESMLDFARSIFGPKTSFKAVNTIHLTKSKTVFQNYTILDVPKEIPARKVVPCHTLSYPYKFFACHYQNSETRVFKVLVGGDNGDRVDAMAVCHMDTSQWSPSHISFRLLGFMPGTAPVCHFFPTDNLVFVPVSAAA